MTRAVVRSSHHARTLSRIKINIKEHKYVDELIRMSVKWSYIYFTASSTKDAMFSQGEVHPSEPSLPRPTPHAKEVFLERRRTQEI